MDAVPLIAALLVIPTRVRLLTIVACEPLVRVKRLFMVPAAPITRLVKSSCAPPSIVRLFLSEFAPMCTVLVERSHAAFSPVRIRWRLPSTSSILLRVPATDSVPLLLKTKPPMPASKSEPIFRVPPSSRIKLFPFGTPRIVSAPSTLIVPLLFTVIWFPPFSSDPI